MKIHLQVLIFTLLFIGCNTERKIESKEGLLIRKIDSNTVEKISYFDYGSIRYKIIMKNGLLDSSSEEYYSNGRIKSRAFWKKGKQSFIYDKYSDDGTPINNHRTIKTSSLKGIKKGRLNNIQIYLSDTIKNVVMLLCDYNDNYISNQIAVIPVNNGIGTIVFKPLKNKGRIKGVIRVKRDSYIFEESYPFDFECITK